MKEGWLEERLFKDEVSFIRIKEMLKKLIVDRHRQEITNNNNNTKLRHAGGQHVLFYVVQGGYSRGDEEFFCRCFSRPVKPCTVFLMPHLKAVTEGVRGVFSDQGGLPDHRPDCAVLKMEFVKIQWLTIQESSVLRLDERKLIKCWKWGWTQLVIRKPRIYDVCWRRKFLVSLADMGAIVLF